MTTKVDSARIATGAGIPTVVASAADAAGALAGQPVGTYFAATGRAPVPACCGWPTWPFRTAGSTWTRARSTP